jgi:hypothetical protein
LIVLEAARIQPAIRQIAVYEPGLLLDRSSRYTGWVGRFDQEVAQGKVAAAVITSVRGLDLAPPAFRLMPRPLAEALTNKSMDSEDQKASGDTVTVRQLAPSLTGAPWWRHLSRVPANPGAVGSSPPSLA